ncbi:MAG: DNA mismatch repair endonuclease MutL [Planctomycetaceae bacterium]|nr:DNA mismatch repair endonuclease MutL [Planctomycetaceae bacterium]
MEVERRIQRLPQSVVNKIAAGEVIERPASVVKELLENAVDALARSIEVDIEAGGAELIRIADDGEGIHPDDVELAVTAHATSKLQSADDLFHVRTMGFRGEALASIAEVSRFKLRTRKAEQLTGVEVDIEAGILKEPRACGCPAGTTVEVRQLFVNTPVRRKFLKAPATEFGHIAEQFTRIALANPNLRLLLRHNGKTVYDLPATSRLSERLELFYGTELADKLIPIEAEAGAARIWGYVAHPSESKSTRKGQYLFLNGRWIQDRSLQHALGEAFRGLLMVGRYPVAFLFLEIPPDDVDVNVHPTKSEVRFRDNQQLYRLVLSTLRTKFLSMDIGAGHRLEAGSEPRPSTPPAAAGRQRQAQQELVSWANSALAGWRPNSDLADLKAKVEPPRVNWPSPVTETVPGANAYGESAFDTTNRPGDAAFSGEHADHVSDDRRVTDADSAEVASPPAAQSSPIRHVSVDESRAGPASADAEIRAMQVHDCYLVIETTQGLTVIDQHALHERIMYEHLRRRVLAGGVEVQRLLMPIPVELSPREAGLLIDQQDLLRELGLQVEEFGGSTVAVTGYPVLTRKTDPVELVKGVVEQLEQTDGKLSRRDLLDSLLHMMACKAAIKAGQRLSPEEIETLLAQRHLVDDAHHCPHGRPTALTLSRQELDRQFGRLG